MGTPSATVHPTALDSPRRRQQSAAPVNERSRSWCVSMALALLAVWVTALGLPRLIVACRDADGQSRLEFVHAPGQCCHGDEGRRGAAHGQPGPGRPAAAADERCHHTGFGIELAPQPRDAGAAALALPPCVGRAAAAPTMGTSARALLPRPPATGPPRRDTRAALRASSLLLS